METQSEHIEKIALALSKAQAQITGAIKDSKNPFFNSSYADLASVWDAIRKPLAANELSIIQIMVDKEDNLFLKTTLVHSSGQWFAGRTKLFISNKRDMQALGSSITYARRYSLAAMMGVPQIDDDGGACSQQANQNIKQKQQVQSTSDALRVLIGKYTDGYKNKEKIDTVCKNLGIEKLEDLKETPDEIKKEMIDHLKENLLCLTK